MNKNQSTKSPLFLAILIALLGLATYLGSLDGAFIWDDSTLIVENNSIRSFHHIIQIFTKQFAYGSLHPLTFYRPVQELSYAIDYHLWGLNPFGYNTTNMACHIAVTISFFFLAMALGARQRVAFFAACAFLVHPIHVEAVDYISGRGEPLCAFFIALTLIFYIKSCSRITWNRSLLVFLFSILALFTKETALMLPFALLFYNLFFHKHIYWRRLLPVWAALFIYAVMRVFIVHHESDFFLSFTHWWLRVPGFFNALSHYARLLLIPYPLHFEVGQILFPWTNPLVITGLFLFILLIAFAYQQRRQNPLKAFAVVWFLLFLLPYSNIYLIYSYRADHHLYLSSFGFFLLLAQGFDALFNKKKSPLILKAVFLVYLLMNITLTNVQHLYWSQPYYFYKRTLQFVPNSFSCHHNLGVVYLKKGHYALAEKHFRKAIAINKRRRCLSYNGLGVALYAQGKTTEAEKTLLEAVRRIPDHIYTLNNLGICYRLKKDYPKSLYYLQKSIHLNPDHNIKAYYLLGLTFYELEEYSRATEAFEKVIRIKPDHRLAYYKLAFICQLTGLENRALKWLEAGYPEKQDFEFFQKKLRARSWAW